MIALVLAMAHAVEPRFDLLEADDGWTDLGTRNSEHGKVSVHSREVDGLTCFGGAVDSDVPVSALVGVASHMVLSPSWSTASLPVSEEFASEERADGRSFVLFQLYDTPGWTFAADRYWVLRGTTSMSGAVGVYEYQRVDPAAWPRVAEVLVDHPGAVEPPTNFGRWTFTPDGEITRVEYRGCSEFGGVVPASIQTALARQQLPNMLTELIDAASDL